MLCFFSVWRSSGLIFRDPKLLINGLMKKTFLFLLRLKKSDVYWKRAIWMWWTFLTFQVLLYHFNKRVYSDPHLILPFHCENCSRSHRQPGSYFGGSLLSVDINKDGKDDLFVGAPLYVGPRYDEGRVFVYTTQQNANLKSWVWKNFFLLCMKSCSCVNRTWWLFWKKQIDFLFYLHWNFGSLFIYSNLYLTVEVHIDWEKGKQQVIL